MTGPLDSKLIPLLRAYKLYSVVAILLGTCLYGVYMTLAIASVRKVLRIPLLSKKARRNILAPIWATMALYTAFVASLTVNLWTVVCPTTIESWDPPSLTVAVVCMTCIGVLGDSIFLYRCWIIWQRSCLVWIPLFLLLCELVFLTFSDVLIGRIEREGQPKLVTDAISVTGMAISLGLNVLLAAAAIAKLLSAHRTLRKAVSQVLPDAGCHYISISRLLAITAVMYTATWLTMILTRHAATQTLVLVILYFVQATSPLLILLHTAHDKDGLANWTISLLQRP
ncbi:hypothetical protein EXIGLDRAFT_762547 [Exidia glandulosa HHB12029]|uniref:G-protein coupled receptors family 1 profile domain-containing protein n=1 Tax=Exidia glandulosa HHB12029 TaxID=1314781 RepID=A0A165MLU2_EXIGL|nr:hypothetical protein EXIGLDRAFT_762547 [Exidia glandulosa HHB12029]